MVEVGNRGTGETIKREEFIARKLAAEANKQSKKNQQQYFYFITKSNLNHSYINLIFRILSSAGKNLTEPFLIELARREEPNRSGKMTVIENNKI